MYLLCGAVHVPYVPVGLHAVLWSHIGMLMRLHAAKSRNTEGKISKISQWSDLTDPVFDVLGLAGFKSRANTFH